MLGVLIAIVGSVSTTLSLPGEQTLGESILIGVVWGLVGGVVNLARD